MDQHLPDGRGTDVARVVRQHDPQTTVVMLTGDTSDDTLIAAVEAGVAAFIPKSQSAATIVELVRRAADGEMVVPRDDLLRVLRRKAEDAAHTNERERTAKQLTPRDREILGLMAGGANTKEIAERTGLAISTVRGHIQTVNEKLFTHSRLEAVLRATELGLVQPITQTGA
jgi:DNA-binding NarL/FixJ family response regulator